MSKCWYCNNELTSGDSPKHFGICNKCYDEMFRSGDTIIRSLTNKISDLEAKLVEKEADIIALDTENYSFKQQIDSLRQQLEEKEKEKEVKILKAMLETGEYWNKKYDDCQQQLALTEKALKLAREYMFNVMCADDVPFESWFIDCAKNDWKPS